MLNPSIRKKPKPILAHTGGTGKCPWQSGICPDSFSLLRVELKLTIMNKEEENPRPISVMTLMSC